MMEVTLYSHFRTIKKAIQQDFYWYDHVEHKSHHAVGGKMALKYDPKQKRCITTVEDAEGDFFENSWNDMLAWAKNSKTVITKVNPNFSLSFKINDYEWNKTRKTLDKLSIKYLTEEIEEEENEE